MARKNKGKNQAPKADGDERFRHGEETEFFHDDLKDIELSLGLSSLTPEERQKFATTQWREENEDERTDDKRC